MKRDLCSDKLIAPWAPNLSAKLVLDRGPIGTAVAVLQLDPEQNAWRNITYISRTLTEIQERHGIIEGA